MARLADDYKNWLNEAEVKVNIKHLTDDEKSIICRIDNEVEKTSDYLKVWRIAKPKVQPVIYRIYDSLKVLLGDYDAVYYHKELAEDFRRINHGS